MNSKRHARPRMAAIAVLATAGIGLIVGLVTWANAPDEYPGEATPSTWLELPAGQLDASQLEVRQLIVGVIEREAGYSPALGYFATLAFSCGQDDSSGLTERYRAYIGDHVLEQNARTWRIDLVPAGTLMQVSVRDLSLRVPPPGTELPTGPAPVARHDIPLVELDAIRHAWGNPALWEHRTSLHCMDGRPALFEACLHGSYFASQRGCSNEYDEVVALWELFQEVVPPPPPRPGFGD